MEHFRFFNSTVGDTREYLASEFSEYFGRFLSDGLYSEGGNVGLKVAVGSGLGITIQTGYGFIRGYMYHNDSALSKTLGASDTLLDRIDRIVLKFDEVAREIKIEVKKGTPSSNPFAPSLVDSTYVKELGLAQIRVRKGSTSVVASDVLDERLTEACGLVSSLIDIPVQEMWNVWNGTLSNIQSVWNNWFASVQNTLGLRFMAGATEPPDLKTGDFWLKEV